MTAFNKWLDGSFTLTKISPLPKKLEGTTSPNPNRGTDESKALVKKFGADNWYDWRVNNWGTKWDVEAEISEVDDKTLAINFDSAWAPPIAAIIKLATMFPNLAFRLSYIEPGMCFAGVFAAKGDDVNDDCLDAGNDKEAYRQMVLDEWDHDPFEDDAEDE